MIATFYTFYDFLSSAATCARTTQRIYHVQRSGQTGSVPRVSPAGCYICGWHCLDWLMRNTTGRLNDS